MQFRVQWHTTFGHEIPKSSSLPSLHFHAPNHKPSVFDLFIFKPERSPNWSRRSNKDAADKSSQIKAVVSSAYKLSLVILFPFSRPLIDSEILIWWASGSNARTKSSPERGHPCLTPLCKQKFWGIAIVDNNWRCSCRKCESSWGNSGQSSWCQAPWKGNPTLGSQRPFQSLRKVSYPLYFHVQFYLKLRRCL